MSIDLESLRIFAKVADLGSFTHAGDQLGIPKARVSLRIKQLENDLGLQLLRRSTRVVTLTNEGEQLLARARHLIVEFEELGSLFAPGPALRGRVRIDMPITIARDIVIPRLPELLARYPYLHVVISTTDRLVAVLREGFDCVLRVGQVREGDLIGHRLGEYRMMNCASPGYLRRYGIPASIADLERHYLIHYSANLIGSPPCFEYPSAGQYLQLPMRSMVTVNGVDAYHTACIAGLGIIQTPYTAILPHVAAGALVEILPEYTCEPMPLTLLHSHGRTPPRRVRAVHTWLRDVLAPYVQRLNRESR